MTRKVMILLLLLVGGASRPVAAQVRALEWLERPGSWLTSGNAAGLHLLPVKKSSRAGVFFTKGDGRLVNYHESTDDYAWGARTGSYSRLDNGVVLHGAIEYKNYKGKNTGGPTFIDPSSNAFNIIEPADSTRGTSTTEQYTLAGAASIPLHRVLHAGARIIYKTANCAKYKDPRHKNTLLDMTLSAGVAYHPTRRVTLGANYTYHRVIEEITHGIYGNTDRQYLFLVDFGSFFGRAEMFGEEGYTSSDGPLFNAFHGASLQLDLAAGQWTLFNEFTYTARRGYFGEKSSISICYFEHEGSAIEYRARLAAPGHLVELRVARETLDNRENIYRQETTPGQMRRIVYYGQSKVFSGNETRAAISYTSCRGLVADWPAWEWSAGGDYLSRSRTTSIYPFFRKQHVRAYNAHLSDGHHRHVGHRGDIIGLSLEVAYGSGNGAPKQDGLYASPSADQAAPKSADHLLYREHEFFTIPRLEARAAISYYTPPLTGNARGYASARATFRHALDEVQYLGGASSRTISIGVGCLF